MVLKLGMLGMWHAHAPGIVRQVAAHAEEFALVGFHDPDPETVRRRAAEWRELVPGFRVFDRPEKLLEEPLDGVVVEGQVHGNLKFAKMALESGRPVLLEKPAGDRWEEFRQVIDLAQRKHLHLQMLYLFRYMPAVLEMLRRARSGELGRLYFFRGRLPKDLGDYDRYVQDFGRYRGGIFFEMAGHLIDMMAVLLGKPGKIHSFLAHHHAAPGKFEDNSVAVFEYEHAYAALEVPALEVAPSSRRIEVYGTEGAVTIPHLGSGHLTNRDIQPVEFCRAGDREWKRLDLKAQPLQISDLREFAACLARKKAPDYSVEHDLIVQEALLRASGAW